MSKLDDQERLDLLRDMLQTSCPPDFETEIFARTLKAARRRAIRRTVLRGTAATAALFLFAAAIHSRWQRPPSEPTTVRVHAHKSIQTVPFGNIIHTERMTERATPSPGVAFIRTQSAAEQGILHPINDEELMNLLRGTGMALIRRGAHGAELIGDPAISGSP